MAAAVVGFSPADAARLAKACKRIERMPQGRPSQRRRSGSSRSVSGHWIGKADSNIASGASGTISIWSGTPGSETDTGNNLTAYNRTDLQIDSGAWCKVTLINGHEYAEPWECPA